MTDRSTAATVAIIGAGIGGCYLVAELGIAGFKLRLHDIDDSRLSEIRARGGMEVERERDGLAAIERVTSDLGSAVDGADVIIVVTGGNTQAVVARSLAPLLRESLDHKFITEDVPTGLIPMSALGTAAGVRTPAIDALVEVVRNMTGKDFAAEARTLERLGVSGMDGPQICSVMREGFPISV